MRHFLTYNMGIYKIITDVRSYQWLLPDIGNSSLLDLMTFDCNSKKYNWPKIKWYPYDTSKKAGNFYSLGGVGAFAFDSKVYESEIFSLLEMAGEILPIDAGGEVLYVLNVLECVNMLDHQSSKWHLYDDGSKGRILEYRFHENCITESSIFKIPETCKGEILTYCNVKSKYDEFRYLYDELKFSGLTFEKLN